MTAGLTAPGLPRAITGCRGDFPGLDVVIANAGVSRAEDMAAGGWDTAVARSIVETNFMGVLNVFAALNPA